MDRRLPAIALIPLAVGSRLVGNRRWQVAASARTPVTGTVTAHAYCTRV